MRTSPDSRPVLHQAGPDRYEGSGFVMSRENGFTPNGNKLSKRWVLRRNGQWIDFDANRLDLAEHNGVRLEGLTAFPVAGAISA